MDWIQTLTIIGALGAIMIYFILRLESDINNLGGRLDSLSSRMDSHAARIDQLYKMFVDLVKAGKS